LWDDFPEDDDERSREDDGRPAASKDTVKHNRESLVNDHITGSARSKEDVPQEEST